MKKITTLSIFATFIIIILSLLSVSSVKAASFKDNQIVSADKTWTVKFSDKVNLDDVSKSGIIVKDSKNNIIPVNLQLNSDGNAILVLPPSNGYKAGENYTLTLNDKIKNIKGKKLSKNIDVHFTISNSIQNETILGNTLGNSVNGGLVAETNNYIYFLNSEYWDMADIYRMDKNEKNIVKINKDDLGEISNLSCINNNIYYRKDYERNPDYDYKTNNKVPEYISNLYMLSSDNTTPTKILTKIDKYILTNNNIYYINVNDNYKLYKADLNGSNITKLIDTPISYFNISKQNIIYSTKEADVSQLLSNDSGGKIYKADLNGSNSSLLTSNIGFRLNTVDNYVYYINYSDNYKIYKVSLDGKENARVCNDSARTINVSDGWIYYCNDSNPITIHVGYDLEQTATLGTLCKIKVDGTGSQKLNNSYSTSINTASDGVYYNTYFDNGSMNADLRTKINKDGTNNIYVSKFVDNSSSDNQGDPNNNTGDSSIVLPDLLDECITVTRDSTGKITKLIFDANKIPSSIKQSVNGFKLVSGNTEFTDDLVSDALNHGISNKLPSLTGVYDFSPREENPYSHVIFALTDSNGKTLACYVK